MATEQKKPRHDTIDEIAEELPAHHDSTGQLTSREARGFPRDSNGRDGYHSAGSADGDARLDAREPNAPAAKPQR